MTFVPIGLLFFISVSLILKQQCRNYSLLENEIALPYTAMRTYDCSTSFAYTGVEKNNDDVRKFHLTKSNKWDAPRDILLVTKRLQITGQHERVRREYNKSNTEYWSTEIRESRSKRRKLSDVLPAEIPLPDSISQDVANIQNLSALEIKEKLKELGLQTRVQKLEKLQEILKQALSKD